MMMGVGALAFGPSFAAGIDLSPEEFRDLVIVLGTRRYPSLRLRAAGQLEVSWGDHHLYLYNAYTGIRVLPPQQREAAILDFLASFSPDADARVNALVADAENWEKARTMLRPKILTVKDAARAPHIVHQPFSSDVVIAYAIDLGDKDLYVDQRRVTKWGVSLAQVHDIALANLEGMSTAMPTSRHLEIGKGRFVVVDSNDGYDAARILLPGLRARVLAALGPRVFASIPGRDFLTFWVQDLPEEKAIESQMQDFAATMPHSLTGKVFVIDAGGIRPA